MTYIPIPEERRRELAAFIPDLAEARRKLGVTPDRGAERLFWTEHVLDIQKVSSRGPTDAVERLWLLRHAYLAAAGTDPIWVFGFLWPGFCARAGRTAVSEGWPLEPTPGAKAPPKEPPKETPCPKRLWFTNGYWRDPTDLTFVAPADSDLTRTSLQVFHDYINRRMAELAMPQIFVNPTPSDLENTMNQTAQQATPFTAASFAFDASSIVEVKTFVFGRDIATLDDDTLLNYAERLTASIEHLEQLNLKTPLAKLVTKIDQLKDAKAKIVELLGGAPVEQASPAIDADETKPKRVRRTKAEIEADKAAQARAELKAAPIPPNPPASKVDPDPNADVDIDYNE